MQVLRISKQYIIKGMALEIKVGLHQRSALRPRLFIIIMNVMLRALKKIHPV